MATDSSAAAALEAKRAAVALRYKGCCGVPPLECIRAEDDPRPRVYSQFDWYAMAFGRIVNAMATTCLTPVAYMLASRDDPKHRMRLTHGGINSWINRTDYGKNDWYNFDDWLATPHNRDGQSLAKSGLIIAAVSLGAMVSTTAAYFLLPPAWKDGKLPSSSAPPSLTWVSLSTSPRSCCLGQPSSTP